MTEINYPTQSKATLLKASVIAVVIALVVYFVLVLPAEYGKDPTGLGKSLGLMVFFQEESVSDNKKSESTAEFAKGSLYPTQKKQVTLTVPAKRGIEYKVKMQKYGRLKFEWQTSGVPLYNDFHGEPKGDATGFFESFSIATARQAKGTMTVPFEGVHGWYWKNTSENEIKVTLNIEGHFEIVGLLK